VNQQPDSINQLLSSFSSIKPFRRVLKEIQNKTGPIKISGLALMPALAVFTVSLIKSLNNWIILVFQSSEEAEIFHDDLESLVSPESIAFFPYQNAQQQNPIESNTVYNHLLNESVPKLFAKSPCIIITSHAALNTRLPDPQQYLDGTIQLEIDQPYKRESLLQKLNDLKYRREYSVEFPYEYAVRGELVDIFPPGSGLPIRIESSDDHIQSIRRFNPETQGTVEKISKILLYPPIIPANNNHDLLDYLPDNTIFAFPHADRQRENIDSLKGSHSDLNTKKQLLLHDIESSPVVFPVQPVPGYVRGTSAVERYLGGLSSSYEDPNIFFFCIHKTQQERLSFLLGRSQIHFISMPLSCGFELPEAGLFINSDLEIFNKRRKTKTFQSLPSDIRHERFNPNEISIHDLLVHLDYGIGKYIGLRKVTAFGSTRECLILEYDGGDYVFVPLEKMTLVHKYRSSGNFIPRLNKLGGGDWDRIKLRTRRSVEKISKEIIDVYSRRLNSSGHAFAHDSDLQMILESDFAFEETPDQLIAIEEIKRDMEKPHPMDRLLCGDVGFGKTEVAIRAAFKSVIDSKQVAVLVPTTILAYQHYITFTTRLKQYPIKIAMISRFVSAPEQKRILKELSNKQIDIIIGTHRLLSKDVGFADLGLLIIDEEHRFGVLAKDKIKKLRTNIDILSLSATPIPRSLHFSLIGARDFSLINTAPKERLPIFTETISFDKNIISQAVHREINRGGQIYFVHNEIRTIASITEKLRSMFPELVIKYIHGQMSEALIEPVMIDFIHNRIQILVTTAIIESGIDIPNANTIFINNAQNFGLSQLYQLRGRVGRYNRKAYAYLIVTKTSNLSDQAIKRLRTIQRYTALGSGYSIALEDLEIRGAGNIFGVEQSGNIHAVGYDLYLKILTDYLNNCKEEEMVPAASEAPTIENISVAFPYEAYFPESYIASESLRLSYYQKLSSVKSIEELQRLFYEICDIFGKLPAPGEYLFDLIEIKLYCAVAGIDKMTLKDNRSVFQFVKNHSYRDTHRLLLYIKEIVASIKISYKFIPGPGLSLAIFYPKIEEIRIVKQFLYLLTTKLNL
jgi:transcription-repair coupling factor (superfamily II helicase)